MKPLILCLFLHPFSFFHNTRADLCPPHFPLIGGLMMTVIQLLDLTFLTSFLVRQPN
jgi:hypothetical protein